MDPADTRYRPWGAVDLPRGWSQAYPELHPSMVKSTRYPAALEAEWLETEMEGARLSQAIRRRQEEISKDEIRNDPVLVELRKQCIASHQQRIRINMDLIKFRKEYDSAQDPRIVTDVIPKEPQ